MPDTRHVRRSDATTTSPTADGAPPGVVDGLGELIGFLRSPAGRERFATSYRDHMEHKARTYAQLCAETNEVVERQRVSVAAMVPQLLAWADADPEAHRWYAFEKVADPLIEAKRAVTRYELLRATAERRVADVGDAHHHRSGDLVRALRHLVRFAAHGHVLQRVLDLVVAFLHDPRLFRTKLMNFMLVGAAGTGKTTLAEAIGDVFAKAGMVLEPSVVVAGRSDLVAQYEGQTVARTRNFLLDNLERVIFIDEAYAVTPWRDRRPEGYGAEAATAMVEFMSRYQGLYCMIVAGYERDMVQHFLATNEGLSRRFPNKYVLSNMSADALVGVFKVKLAEARGGGGGGGSVEARFTPRAWAYLHALVAACTDGHHEHVRENDEATGRVHHRVRRFRPRWELLYTIFAHQAAAMTTLADEAVTILAARAGFAEEVAVDGGGGGDRVRGGSRRRRRALAEDVDVMRSIVVSVVGKSALSDEAAFLEELRCVEAQHGLQVVDDRDRRHGAW